MVSLALLQGIFLTQESNWGLLHCRWILYQLRYQGSPLRSCTHTNLVSNSILLKLCRRKNTRLLLPWILWHSPAWLSNLSLLTREGGTVLEVLSLLCFPFAWQSTKATLSFSVALSPYFCLALVHREPTFCQHFWSTCSSIRPTPILQHHFGASMHFLISFLSLATSLLHTLDPIFHLNNLFFTNPLKALWPLSLPSPDKSSYLDVLGSFLHQGWGEFRMKADKWYRVSVAILGSAAVKRHFIPITLLLPIFLRKRDQPESLRIFFQFGMKRTTACNVGGVYLNQKSGWIVSLPNLYFNYSNWLESYKVCRTFTKGRKLGEQGWKQLLGKKRWSCFKFISK